ncbi:MAG: peptidoglycan bridge formation glycyltransferase FemA/FemB family protein [Candidatus Nomurabacteria bacterium]|jgi:lipid II:glycine glycyltransferase (peptidoglycan interpeptide bridge formation enzyme)|nr:peptidoglycan bridge formation glycyltransferase FemA/FemB family protein [Candidatus Nomurabacteria bacterium]
MVRLENIRPEELDKFVVKTHPEANFLQSSGWGKVYELTHEKVFYLGLRDEGKLMGSAVVILKPAKRGHYLEIPGGPLVDWGDKKVVKLLLDGLRELAEKERCVFVRMRPNIEDNGKNRKIFGQSGLSVSPMHLHAEHTVMIDLTKSEDELLAAMRRQTRYEVKRADRLGIRVDYDTSDKAFREFYEVQKETALRQKFITSSEEFILAQREVFGEEARIYRAEMNGEILALGLILMQAPEAIYHEAASTELGRKYPGAYALQWRVTRDAKAMGLKRYNLFGIAPPNTKNHRYAGVTTFKMGFGGEAVSYLPAHDLVVNPLAYQMTKIIENARKRKRHL